MTCAVCASPVRDGDRYCEACGHDLAAAPPTDTSTSADHDTAAAPVTGTSPSAGRDSTAGAHDGAEPAPPGRLDTGQDVPAPVGVAGGRGLLGEGEAGRWLLSGGAPAACTGCGSRSFGAEGYCDGCGQRRGAGEDRGELDLGVLAGVTDIGHHHHRNEDSMGIGVLADAIVAIVCDGVSSSDRPDAAAHAATGAATPALVRALAGGAEPEAAIGTAARAAQAAAALVAGPEPGANPPSCTFVCAAVTDKAVTVGWVGDSRAYWLPDDDGDMGPAAGSGDIGPAAGSGGMGPAAGSGGPVCLTTDDSFAGRLAAAGAPAEVIAAHPKAAALVRWLGADAVDTAPHLRTFHPSGPGRVLVCSDGLSRYRPATADLAAAVPAGPPLDTARELVRLALDEGGHDNVTVVLLPFPPHVAGGSTP